MYVPINYMRHYVQQQHIKGGTRFASNIITMSLAGILKVFVSLHVTEWRKLSAKEITFDCNRKQSTCFVFETWENVCDCVASMCSTYRLVFSNHSKWISMYLYIKFFYVEMRLSKAWLGFNDILASLPYADGNYRKTSNISRTLVGNKIVDNSDVVGASPVGAAPTTSSFSTQRLASKDWAKTAARRYKKHLSFGIWCDLY